MGVHYYPGTHTQLGTAWVPATHMGPDTLSWEKGAEQHGLWDMYSCGQPGVGKGKGYVT